MARIQRDVVDYFPHDANVDGEIGDTLAVLEGQFGNNGYTFWYKLMERLASTEGHFIDCNNSKKWQLLLARARVNHETTVEIMNLLVEMGAIDKELWEQYKIIWCQSLVDNVADVYKNRKRELPQKPNPLQPKLNLASSANIPTEDKGISTGKKPLTTPENTQSKVKESKVNNTPKGGQHKVQSPPKKDSIVNEIYAEMRAYLGYPDKTSEDPIPSYGKEGQAIKRMLTRGFTRKAIVACWKSKVSQRGGEFVSMTWVNEDIGKPEKQKGGARRLSTEEEIAASIRKVTT